LWTFGIKFSLTVETTSFQQLTTVSVVFTDIHYIFFASFAYNICRDCFQCSLTLSVTCSRCEALYFV